MLLLKCMGASVPPFAVLQAYLYLIGKDSPTILSDTVVKVVGVAGVLILSNVGQVFILMGGTSPTWQRILKVNFLIWFFFFFFFTIDAFTVHKGLAKDFERSMLNMYLSWALRLGVFGLPLTLFNTLVLKVTMKAGLIKHRPKVGD